MGLTILRRLLHPGVRRRWRARLSLTSSAPRVEAVEPRLLFAVFTVTTVANSGVGSLRQAILNANAAAGEDDIEFDVGTGGAQVIRPTSALPAITGSVNLDATTQPGYEDVPLIEVRGDLAGAGVVGLRVNSSDPLFASSVAGLAITRFAGAGVSIGGDLNGLTDCYVGAVPAGTAGSGNGGAGVTITGSGNVLSENVIAGNGGAGVAVTAGAGNDLAQNEYRGNGGLGIDLGPAGRTPNDAADADAGPNGLQNFPVLTGAVASAGGTHVTGTLSATPEVDLDVDLYATPAGDKEGQTYLGGTTVTTDAAGGAAFDVDVGLDAVPAGYVVTATASLLDVEVGDTVGSSTSEFSDPVPVTVDPPHLAAVTVGDGTAQRSAVTQVSLAFDQPVTLAPTAVTLARLNTGGSGSNNGAAPTDATAALATPTSDDGGRTWVYTFAAGAFTEAGGSLKDGIYTLTVNPAGVTGAGGQTLAAGASVTFHRKFGDLDGNKAVNNADYVRFRNAFGTAAGAAAYNPPFDYDGNGAINNGDYLQFRGRFGTAFTYG